MPVPRAVICVPAVVVPPVSVWPTEKVPDAFEPVSVSVP